MERTAAHPSYSAYIPKKLKCVCVEKTSTVDRPIKPTILLQVLRPTPSDNKHIFFESFKRGGRECGGTGITLLLAHALQIFTMHSVTLLIGHTSFHSSPNCFVRLLPLYCHDVLKVSTAILCTMPRMDNR